MFPATQTNYGPNVLSWLLAARSASQVDGYAKTAWILHGEGLIQDKDMEYLAPIIDHQRRSTAAVNATWPACPHERHAHVRPPIPPAKRETLLLQRRTNAKNCIMPTSLARNFTGGKLAVLGVIARAVIDRGCSNMSLPEIAARAGVGCSTARYAIREAARMGLVSVQENRIHQTWCRPNTIRIVCKRWLDWLAGHVKLVKRPKRIQTPPTPLRNANPKIDIKRFKLSAERNASSANACDPPQPVELIPK